MTLARRATVVVQARIGSTRLPGKVMEVLRDRTVLAEVLSRCFQIPGIHQVWCAIPDTAENAAVAAEARRVGAKVYLHPGHEANVLDRYAATATAADADIILRVTSDCPLIDPIVCGEVLSLLANGELDYASNNLQPAWPHGLDCEAFTRSCLSRAVTGSASDDDREHVTPWMRRHASVRRQHLPCPLPNISKHRWTVDTPEDLAFARAIFSLLPSDTEAHRYATVLRILDEHPHLSQINAKNVGISRPAAGVNR